MALVKAKHLVEELKVKNQDLVLLLKVLKVVHWDIAVRQATDSGQGLSAFLSRLSVLGMIIAVSVLLAALSVMNGFEREMRVRILSLVPHVTIRGYADEIEWGQIQSDLVELSSVLRTVRFTDLDAMLTADGQAQVIRLAIADSQVLPVYESYLAPPISSLRANEVILGSALASSLGVKVGDRVSALYSVGAVGNRLVPGGLSVVSILDSETEIDQIFALAGPNSGKLNQLELGSGLSLTLSDPLVAARLSSQLKVALTPNFWVTDWTSSQGNLYQAIEPAATSSTFPARPSGVASFIPSNTFSSSASVISVSMYPGATTFARTFLEASSLAYDLVNPTKPAFDAA